MQLASQQSELFTTPIRTCAGHTSVLVPVEGALNGTEQLRFTQVVAQCIPGRGRMLQAAASDSRAIMARRTSNPRARGSQHNSRRVTIDEKNACHTMPPLSSSASLKSFLKAILESPDLQEAMQEEISTEQLVEIAAKHGHQVSVDEVNANPLWQAGGFKYLV